VDYTSATKFYLVNDRDTVSHRLAHDFAEFFRHLKIAQDHQYVPNGGRARVVEIDEA
jgi:hypothetical protein